MEDKEKKDKVNNPGKEGATHNTRQQDGHVGHQNAQPGGKKTGANRDEDTEPTGEDEHGQ